MSTTEQQPSELPEKDSSEPNSKPEQNITRNDGEWDGTERRSKDRPWSDEEKNENKDEQVLTDEERKALSEDVEKLTDEAGVITYDFYSPAHINKSNLPALAVINEKITESLLDSLQNLLQRELEVSSEEIEISRYNDFIYSLPTLVDTNIINISKIDAQAIVCIDGALIEIVMDAYFGGEGKLGEINNKQSFTDTEINISNKMLEIFLISNKTAWDRVEKLDFQFLQRELQPKLINMLDESDLVVVCQFKVSLDSEASFIRVAYPYKALEPIKHSLRNMVQERDDQYDGQWKRQFFNSVKTAPIELNTVLTEFNLTVDEVVKLKTGDVIPFQMPDSVTVYSKTIPIFKGKIGSVNDSVAISIDSWIRKNEK